MVKAGQGRLSRAVRRRHPLCGRIVADVIVELHFTGCGAGLQVHGLNGSAQVFRGVVGVAVDGGLCRRDTRCGKQVKITAVDVVKIEADLVAAGHGDKVGDLQRTELDALHADVCNRAVREAVAILHVTVIFFDLDQREAGLLCGINGVIGCSDCSCRRCQHRHNHHSCNCAAHKLFVFHLCSPYNLQVPQHLFYSRYQFGRLDNSGPLSQNQSWIHLQTNCLFLVDQSCQ